MLNPYRFRLVAATLFLSLGSVANANVISNGDFSAGFSGWTNANSGVTTDPTTVWVLSSPGGASDPTANNGSSFGPASRVLFQDFMVPVSGVSSAAFSFDFYSNNGTPLDSPLVDNVQGGSFAGPNVFRIDIVDPSAPVFTTPFLFELFEDAGGVVGSAVALVGQTFGSPGSLQTFLNANAGNTLRLRIGNAESTFPWDMSVDNINLSLVAAGVPEPATNALLLAGLLSVGYVRRRRLRAH